MRTIRQGDFVRIKFHGTHYAVVLKSLGAHCVVIVGTSSRRTNVPCVVADPEDESGRFLELEWRTYFYPQNTVPIRTTDIVECRLRCPVELFVQLRKLSESVVVDLQHLQTAELDAIALRRAQPLRKSPTRPS